MILSTCNRVEILVHGSGESSLLPEVRSFVGERRSLSPGEIDRYTYHYEDRAAVRHLFRVASGLDSMVLGEPQILGQVKQAYAASRQAGTIGSVLDHLLRRGLGAAKRIRTETGISRHAVSIAYAAVELGRKIFGGLEGRAALLLGAGKMGGLVATHLVSNGIEPLIIASRTFNRSAQFAERFAGTPVHWDACFEHLQTADIVVSGTGATHTVLSKEMVQQAIRRRRNRPLFVIDIAVPRDVEPAVNELDNVYLYDIDDLQNVVDSNLQERQRAAELAETQIDREVKAFEAWLESLKITPTIIALRHNLHGLGAAELERFRRRLGPMSPEQDEQVQELVRSLVQKILHRPIRHLKGSVERGDAARMSALYHRVFGIEPAGGEPDDSRGPSRVIPGGKQEETG